MRVSILKEFGVRKPRAAVLDDNAHARRMTARQLRKRGFETVECATADEFLQVWKPGTVDVVIADWHLSNDPKENGDKMLEAVRKRDWDVPFVLISGQLDEDTERAKILQHLLNSGGATFVQRGDGGIRKACERAEDLIERRDLALLKLILALRSGALEGVHTKTSSGEQPVAKLLESIVSKPKASHNAERPIASNRSRF